MRWPLFMVAMYLFLGLDLGLRPLFAVHVGNAVIAPSFLLILMVAAASVAPATSAMWAAAVLGLLVDLTSPLVAGPEAVVVVAGPHALGFVLGAALVVQLRIMVNRKNPITIAILTALAGLCAHVVAVFMLSVRAMVAPHFESMYDPFAWNASFEIVCRFLDSLATGVLAMPVGWMLSKVAAMMVYQVHPRLASMR